MSDRPIIFSAPMVRALLAGRKTQTRRIIRFPSWASGIFTDPLKIVVELGDDLGHDPEVICEDTGCLARLPMRFVKGDRLWLREAYAVDNLAATNVIFRAAHEEAIGYGPRVDVRWRSPIHMPRWASRLTLDVTDVRVQRLQDISRNDVIAEGTLDREGFPVSEVWAGWHDPYADLWDSLHGPGAWAANPWICALTFTVVTRNIDADREAA